MKRILLLITLLFAVGLSAQTKITNVSINAEGTGNVITFPIKAWFPAASCQNASPAANWDMLSGAIPSATCFIGTNVVRGLLRYPVNTQDAAQFTYLLPADLTSGTAWDGKLVWLTSTASGTATFAIDYSCTSIGSADDTAFTAWQSLVLTASATANAPNAGTFSGATTTCTAGQLVHFRVKRTDTAGTAANADVYGLELTYRRSS